MADKFVKVTLTNTDKGSRGIAAKGGIALLGAGETVEIEVPQAELDDLPEHFKVTGKAKAAAKADVGDKSYDAMKRDELDKLAAERGIDISDASNKAEVIALLEAADQA